MPDPARVRKEAEIIRRKLLKRFGSQERLLKMNFSDKKHLLHWLFDGKDPEGKPYGIYVSRCGGVGKKFDYFLWGRIVGLRTLKGDDINYQAWDEEENEYKTKIVAQ